MTASGEPAPGIALDRRAGIGEGQALRIRLYGFCLLGSIALFALVHGWVSGFLALAPAGAVAALLVGAALAAPANARRLAEGACLLAFATVLSVPLAGRMAEGLSLPAAVRATTVWPQILVLLFASRVLAELCEERFAAFWRAPLDAGARPRTQSMAAATLLGAALTLVFYQATAGFAVAAGRLDPPAIVWRALTGETAVHAAIVVLFFVLLAAILDAAMLSAGDGAVLDALKRLCLSREREGEALTRQGLRDFARSRLPSFSHTRTIQTIEAATAADLPDKRAFGGHPPLEVFHAASRRLIRALLSFLPLLGFLGTVIGLTAAIGSLPSDLGPSAAGGTDISASLAGLAVKFETTLLGLAGGLVASLLLALVERRESELGAECLRLVGSRPG